MSDKKTFKISGLTPMTKGELTENDLFLVSDADDPKTNSQFTTKSLSYSTLSSAVVDATAKSKAVKDEIKDEVKYQLENNIQKYAPIQTWYEKGSDAPAELEVEDGTIILSCGAASAD